MSGTSLVSRAITLVFELGKGDYGLAPGPSAVTATGLRVSASISETGGVGYTTAQIRVSGLSASIQNRLSSLGTLGTYTVRNNQVTVFAGDATNGMFVAFKGVISEAWVDFSGAPETSFNVTAFTGLFDNMKPVAVTSMKGPVDVVSLMSGFANLGGYTLENSGVAGVVLSNPHYDGTARQQAQRCADDANINLYYDAKANVLAIWPRGKARGGSVPLVSAKTGMRGYPSFSSGGIMVTTLYNPSLRMDGSVNIESVIPQANGLWIINRNLTHELSSETVDGPWFSTFERLIGDSRAAPTNKPLPSFSTDL